jgi:hypothetical protein
MKLTSFLTLSFAALAMAFPASHLGESLDNVIIQSRSDVLANSKVMASGISPTEIPALQGESFLRILFDGDHMV